MVTMVGRGSNSAKVILADKEKLSYFWYDIEQILQSNGKGIEEFYTPEQVREIVFRGVFECWVIVDNCEVKLVILSNFEVFPTKKLFHVHWIGGSELKKYLSIIVRALEHWAKLNQADVVSIHGRKGWEKLLARYGYKQRSVVLTKSIQVLWSN